MRLVDQRADQPVGGLGAEIENGAAALLQLARQCLAAAGAARGEPALQGAFAQPRHERLHPVGQFDQAVRVGFHEGTERRAIGAAAPEIVEGRQHDAAGRESLRLARRHVGDDGQRRQRAARRSRGLRSGFDEASTQDLDARRLGQGGDCELATAAVAAALAMRPGALRGEARDVFTASWQPRQFQRGQFRRGEKVGSDIDHPAAVIAGGGYAVDVGASTAPRRQARGETVASAGGTDTGCCDSRKGERLLICEPERRSAALLWNAWPLTPPHGVV